MIKGSRKYKCTSANERFGASGGATRPKFCVTLQRWLSSALLRYPRLLPSRRTLGAMRSDSAVLKEEIEL